MIVGVVRLLDAGEVQPEDVARWCAGADLSRLEGIWDKVLEATQGTPERRR